jgi:hypothetical protein
MPYKRKTEDEYNIEGNYQRQWEIVACEETWPAAKEQVKCYRENEPGIAFRIKKQRVKINSITFNKPGAGFKNRGKDETL